MVVGVDPQGRHDLVDELVIPLRLAPAVEQGQRREAHSILRSTGVEDLPRDVRDSRNHPAAVRDAGCEVSEVRPSRVDQLLRHLHQRDLRYRRPHRHGEPPHHLVVVGRAAGPAALDHVAVAVVVQQHARPGLAAEPPLVLDQSDRRRPVGSRLNEEANRRLVRGAVLRLGERGRIPRGPRSVPVDHPSPPYQNT